MVGRQIDNEGNSLQHWPYLATSFRALFSTAMKPYYLSSAPQCLSPFSDPLPMLLQCDFVCEFHLPLAFSPSKKGARSLTPLTQGSNSTTRPRAKSARPASTPASSRGPSTSTPPPCPRNRGCISVPLPGRTRARWRTRGL